MFVFYRNFKNGSFEALCSIRKKGCKSVREIDDLIRSVNMELLKIYVSVIKWDQASDRKIV